MSKIRTHYDNLRVARNADTATIRAAFRSLSQKHHPDKNPEDRERAEAIFKMIGRAYDVLSDPHKRRQHDEWIAREEGRARFDGAGTAGAAGTGHRAGQRPAASRPSYRGPPPGGRRHAGSYQRGRPSGTGSGSGMHARGRTGLRDANLRSSTILKAMVLCRRVESSGGMIVFISMLSGLLAAAAYAIVSVF